MDHKEYLLNYIESSIYSWKLSQGLSVLSPIKNQEISIDNIVWFNGEGLGHGELLWLYSLGAHVRIYQAVIHNLINENKTGVEETIKNSLEDFLIFQSSKENKYIYDIRISRSFDHCLAVRIRYLCMLIAMDYPYPDILKRIILKDLEWFKNIDSIPLNNHGMMVCISILHASLFVYDDTVDNLVEKALLLLKNVINHMVPSNYYVRENTPAYHNFYMQSLRSFYIFLKRYGFSDEYIVYLTEIVNGLEKVFSQVIYPSGEIPPIGQSGLYPTDIKSIPGKFLFKEQGFFVNKNETNYFSLTCGHSSVVHKQNDDTAITLRIDNIDIFVDCGIGSYDHNELQATVLNGQRGHSGAFFKKFDCLTLWEFYGAKSDKISNLKYKLDESNNQITCSRSFNYNKCFYEINRTVNFSSFYNLTIKDVFISDDVFASPVSRFILDDFKNYKVEDNKITMENDIYRVTILCWSSASFNVLASYDGECINSIAFRSLKWNEYKSVNVVEITPLVGELEVNIIIEPLDK